MDDFYVLCTKIDEMNQVLERIAEALEKIAPAFEGAGGVRVTRGKSNADQRV
jgi:hypothetical protein